MQKTRLLIHEAAIALEQHVHLHHLQPSLWLQEILQLFNIALPPVAIYSVDQKAAIDQVERFWAQGRISTSSERGVEIPSLLREVLDALLVVFFVSAIVSIALPSEDIDSDHLQSISQPEHGPK